MALPLVLPPTVLGFYLLVALGPNGPGGLIAGLWGARTLAFTFEGLVIGSVIYSMPFVVQPIRNAFEAIGERPLEVAATLRASPRDAFWTVAVPLARPGFMTGAVLGFAHTVGEFGVVLMIGGNIPGETKVLSVAIYDYVETSHWREASILAAGMVVFAFAVILAMTLIEKRVARAGRMSAEQDDPRRVPRHARALPARRRLRRAGDAASPGCSDRPAAARPRSCAASRACSACGTAIAPSAATSGRTRTTVPTSASSGRSATSSRKRACSRIFRCGATCSTARRRKRAAAKGGIALRRGRRSAGPAEASRPVAAATSPAASASASPSAARCSRSRSCS